MRYQTTAGFDAALAKDRSIPISVSRAIHRASSLSVFGRPGRFLAWEEFTSCTASPASSRTANQTRQ